MKNKTDKLVSIVIICVIVGIAVIAYFFLKSDSKNLENEKEKLNNLIVETKDGTLIQTEYTAVDDNKFYVKVPTYFHKMTDEEIQTKYPTDGPSIVFSNDETTINVAFKLTDDKMANNEIEDFQNTMVNVLKESGEIITTDYYGVDNHNVGTIKVLTHASDTDIYNHMMFFSYEGKLVVITFNCTADLQDNYEVVGDFIIESLFFN